MITAGPSNVRQSTLPPGPPESYDVKDDLLLWLKQNYEKFGSIYRASIYGSDVYVLSEPAYCEHVLRYNWENYPRTGLVVKRISLSLGNGLITSNGPFWISQRRMIQPAFTKAAANRSIGLLCGVSEELLEKWKGAAAARMPVNVTRDVSEAVLKITLISIFGDDYSKIASDFAIFCENPSRNIRFAAHLPLLRKRVLDIVRARRIRNEEADDILALIMRARDRDSNEPMPEMQLAREILTLIVAGHETTASLLNWLWWLLAKHPDVHLALSQELQCLPDRFEAGMLENFSFTRQVIDEALRLYPPLWLMTRKAVRDDHAGPYRIPAGTEIFISPFLMQRSPSLWELPEKFDPWRKASVANTGGERLAFCPFGAGPRNCIGEHFARLEMQIHLMIVARQLRMIMDDNEVPRHDTAGLNLMSKEDFIMQPEVIGHDGSKGEAVL